MRLGHQGRWRWHLKTAVASAISQARRYPISRRLIRSPQRPLIIGYHRVVEDFAATARTTMPSMLISRAMFERHLDWIGRQYRFATLDEIGERLSSGEPFSEPVAAITFDDGYRDVFDHAFPILERKGIPGALFVVTDLVGHDVWQIHDKLYHLVTKAFAAWKDPKYHLCGLLTDLGMPVDLLRARAATSNPLTTVSALLPGLSHAEVGRVMDGLEAIVGNGIRGVPPILTWSMIAEMRRAGLTIGSHTRTHVSLPMESPDVVAEELAGSKWALERHLGEPIWHFAYPGGQFTPEVVDALIVAGYRYGYTACPHGDPRYPILTMERLLLWERSSVDADGRFSANVLNCQVDDLWPPTRRCGRLHHA